MKFDWSKRKIITVATVFIVLLGAFWWGGNAPGLQGFNTTARPNSSVPSEQMSDTIDYADSADKPSDKPLLDSAKEEKPKSNDIKQPIEAMKAQTAGEKTAPSVESPEKSKDKTAEKKDQPAKTEKNKGIDARPGGAEGGLSADEKVKLAAKMAGTASSPGVKKGDANYSKKQGMTIDASTGKDKYLTDPVPEGKPIPVEPQAAKISDTALSCTLSVRCDTILKNMDWLDPDKVELVPADGVIFAEQTVTFYEGESVFNVLQREMKKAKIHMEFQNTPMYNSAYIEGINNLYEFDCGELSGWMYKVNGWFPNYGCSRYQLKAGDKIEWVYTCDLGVDVGGFYSTGG